jgi:uncharacterized protein YyaL (SSP411 family)
MQHKHTNALIHETSPYLLQHAHNPVDWYAWNEEILEKAKLENKIILVSIGYSACHWCHVMEHESFEDMQVANIMNEHFICIKVDREERPDIDQIYMLAVQLMTGGGGWPLNCFALPDGKPIYGGTYFPKQQWITILQNIAQLYKNDTAEVLEYASQLTEGIKYADLIKMPNQQTTLSIDVVHQSYDNWKKNFDNKNGGPNKAPKFPLPANYRFLLHYAFSKSITNETKEELMNHICLTLQKMAYGGIYDQIGGGFSRYSVDSYWKVPHFEKMLYDNAQLVSLYSKAYQATKMELYKQVVSETLAFVERELTSAQGAFYSSLDADSEGVEGKYYVWTKEELTNILKGKFSLFADYYNVNGRGLWEHNCYILLRHENDEHIASKHHISLEHLHTFIQECKRILLHVREKRVHPAVDNKILTSWNALMLKAYADAYQVFDDKHFLDVAIKNADFIFTNLMHADGKLYHTYSLTTTTINGFLEDYCFFIEALIALYESTFNEFYLSKANVLMTYCIEHFMDKNGNLFYFSSDLDNPLISRKIELSDNVIPASNSSIAISLFKLGHHFENEKYIDISRKMLNYVTQEIISYGAGYSNWASLLLFFTLPFYEVVIIGKDAPKKMKKFNRYYLPNTIFAGDENESSLPLLKNRYMNNNTLIYVCENKTCQLPVNEVSEAVKSILA